MKKILSIGLVMALSAAAWAAPTLDGVIGTEWDGFIVTDPGNDRSIPADPAKECVEMTRWGARVEGGYLYWFSELSVSEGYKFTDFNGFVGTKAKKIYPSLWIDADPTNSTQTYLHDLEYDEEHPENPPEGYDNCADGKPQWGTNHRGIDLNLELGLETGSWTNGQMDLYNYWGGDSTYTDNVYYMTSGVQDGSWCANDYVIEACVSLAQLETLISSLYDGVVPADNWLVGVAVQATNRGTVDYGYDVGNPTALNVDGAALLEGDYNLDGKVDVSDLGILATNYGKTTAQSWMMGDSNRDGAVDVSDLGELATNYGKPVPSGAIPEPATMSLLGLGIFSLIRRKK